MKKTLFVTVAVAIVLGSFASAIVTPAAAEDRKPITMQDFFWWSNVSDTVADAELLPVSGDDLFISSNRLMFAETSIAYSVTIPASKDTAIGYCANWGPDANNGNKPSFVAWNNSPTADLNSLIEFSLESIPADACIYQADLALYCFNFYGSSAIPVGVYKQPHTDWEELQATYNIYKTGSNWTTQGGDYVTSDPAGTVMMVPPASQGFVQWNIIDIVNDARTRGIPVELLIKATAHGNDYSDAGFCSREYYQDTWLRPKLIIGYTSSATPTPTPTPAPTATPWSFAIITDTHVGERAEGGDFGAPGWDDDGIYNSSYGSADMRDKGIKSLQSSVEAINQARGMYNIKFLAVLGDITHHAEPSAMHAASDVLNNSLVPWVPLIGNHDLWPQVGDDDRAPNPDYLDGGNDKYFNTWFSNVYQNFADQLLLPSTWKAPVPTLNPETEPDFYSYFQNFQFDYGDFHFVGLDFVTRKGSQDTGTMPEADLHNFDGGTWYWFNDYLERNPVDSESIILLAHHQIKQGWWKTPQSHFDKSEWEIIEDDLSVYEDEILIEFAGHMHNNGWANGPGFKIQCTDKNADHQTVRIVQVFPDGTINYDTILPKYAASFTAHCPVDLILTDPDGLVVSRTENQIPDAMYDKWDLDEDGLIETDIWIPDRKPGTYSIQVIPESYANASDTFTLTVSPMEYKWGYTPITIAQDVSISDIPAEPYTFEFTQRTATNISYIGDISGYNFDTVNLAAVLSDENGNSVSGKTVNFLIGNQSASATTDADGMASVFLLLDQSYSGLCSVEYGFDGDIDYLPYYDAQMFVIPPVADAGGPYAGNEGSAIPIDGGGTYDPEDRVVSYEWDLDNDGLFDDAAGVTPVYTWDDDYSDYISVKVTDSNGAISFDLVKADITNMPPTVEAGADINNAIEGIAVNFSGGFTDPGALDTHAIEWDFGDGSPTVNGTLTPLHIYTTSGEYTVTLTVTDDDGGIGADTLSVGMAPSATTYTFASGGGANKWCSAGHVHLIDWNKGHPASPGDLVNSYGYVIGGVSQYSAVSSSDDVRWRSDISHCLGCCAFDRNCELFTFKINEAPATITNIQIKWEGHGTTGETIYYTTEKLWNAASNSWSTLNNQKNMTGDITWTNNISSGCSNYIDASGNLNILLAAQRSGLPNNCGVWTDYIEVTINHK